MVARPGPCLVGLGIVTHTAWVFGQTATAALPPAEQELRSIEADVSARAQREATAGRAYVRPFVEVGVSVGRSANQTSGTDTLERQPGAAPLLAVGIRRGFGALLELDLRLEAVAPNAVSAFPAALAEAARDQPCAGSRRFDLPGASAVDVALATALRVRLVRASSPFYVGLGLRFTASYADVRGTATARCEGASPTPPPARAEVTEVSWTTRADAVVETGFRFGEHEAWDVGLRMIVTEVGTNSTRVGGAQWFVAWHFR